MNNKIISIIIPSYNMEKFLNNCIKSLIISEEYLNRQEIIIVNDGSKDKTIEIAKSWEEKYPNVIKVIDKQNGNYGSCINSALKIATGTFVKVLDSDDHFNITNYENFIKYILASETSNENIDVFITDFEMIDQDNNIIKTIQYPFSTTNIFSFPDFPENIIEIMCMHSLTYRLKKIHEINYFQTEGISYTDQEWIFSPMMNMNNFKYFPYIIYRYLVGRDGQTINPETHLKNLWMEIKCTEKMINDYTSKLSSISYSALSYLDKKIYDRTYLMYKYYICDFRKKVNFNELNDFDDFLKTKLPTVYDKLSNTSFMGFKYIKFYRKNKNKNALLRKLNSRFIVLICLQRIINFIHK